MNYNKFLFYNLSQITDTKHPIKFLAYDVAFNLINKYYLEFEESNYNVSKKDLYTCITNYLKNYE